jgi:hypothetical protein
MHYTIKWEIFLENRVLINKKSQPVENIHRVSTLHWDLPPKKVLITANTMLTNEIGSL